jgi:hypothetical protein
MKKTFVTIMAVLSLFLIGSAGVHAQEALPCENGGRGFQAEEMRDGFLLVEFVGVACDDEESTEELFDRLEEGYTDAYEEYLADQGADLEPFEEIDDNDLPDIGDDQVGYSTTGSLNDVKAEITILIVRIGSDVHVVIGIGATDVEEDVLSFAVQYYDDDLEGDTIMDRIPDEDDLPGFVMVVENEPDDEEGTVG